MFYNTLLCFDCNFYMLLITNIFYKQIANSGVTTIYLAVMCTTKQ